MTDLSAPSSFMADRRKVIAAGVAGVAVLAGAGYWAGLFGKKDANATTAAALLQPNPLPDLWLGAANAPVTMIEYASMTCTHCAAFHAQTFPVLKSKYIDTGKVRFVLREFPLDPLATAAFMLARCAGDDKRAGLVDLLFAQQRNWAFREQPVEALATLMRQTGMSRETFDACLKDQATFEKVNASRDRASETFAVDATPTFFINGRKIGGEMTPEELDKAIAPLV